VEFEDINKQTFTGYSFRNKQNKEDEEGKKNDVEIEEGLYLPENFFEQSDTGEYNYNKKKTRTKSYVKLRLHL